MGKGEARGKEERIAVPAMPMPLAVICCVLNFIIPGLGTTIAGFSAFWCARNEDMGVSTRCGTCCISLLFGFLQLLLTAACLIGWIWSCAWGVFMIGMSVEYYHNDPANIVRPRPGGIVNPSVIMRQPMGGGGSVYRSYQAPVVYGPMPGYHHHGNFTLPNQYPEPPPYSHVTLTVPSPDAPGDPENPDPQSVMEHIPASPPPPYQV